MKVKTLAQSLQRWHDSKNGREWSGGIHIDELHMFAKNSKQKEYLDSLLSDKFLALNMIDAYTKIIKKKLFVGDGRNPLTLVIHYRSSYILDKNHDYSQIDRSTPPEFFSENMNYIFKPDKNKYLKKIDNFLRLPSWLESWYVCELAYHQGKLKEYRRAIYIMPKTSA